MGRAREIIYLVSALIYKYPRLVRSRYFRYCGVNMVTRGVSFMDRRYIPVCF